MKASFIIPTHNRRRDLIRTLERIEAASGLEDAERETWVVDNASTNGTADAVSRRFPDVRLIRNTTNDGPCARTDAIDLARGAYLVFLDDDSYPIGDAVGRSIEQLEARPRSAVVAGRVVLPDGSLEAAAFPATPLSGAMCVRADVMRRVGGFCRRLVRQAEELDLALRILDAGYRIERFEDIVYGHDKPPGRRRTAQVHRLDVRNNLVVLDRHVPDPLRSRYREDWIQRYAALAGADNQLEAAMSGRAEADDWAGGADRCARRPVGPSAIETMFQPERQARVVSAWASAEHVHRVCIADFGKNIYATYRACREAGLSISAVAEPHACFAGARYRDLPITSDDAALPHVDGVVLCNINPAQVDRRYAQLRDRFDGPILCLFEARRLTDQPGGAPTERDAVPTACAAN